NAAEIVGIQHMLGPDTPSGRCAQIGLEDKQDRFQHGNARQPQGSTALIDPAGKRLVYHRIEDDARLLLYVVEHLHQLPFGTDEGVDVLDCPRTIVLRGSGTARRQQSLSGSIRDHVQMKEALRFVHAVFSDLWAAVEKG